MNFLFLAASFVPGGLLTIVIVLAMVCAVVLCAIYQKGDVKVHVVRGKTSFELDAKERSPGRR
jgi:hypothetical protein